MPIRSNSWQLSEGLPSFASEFGQGLLDITAAVAGIVIFGCVATGVHLL
jgi:hypothetical protein